jgi:hypothetical protein
MNGDWKSSQLYLTVLVLALSFVALVMRLINGTQFTVIWTSGVAGIGVRKYVQHRNDKPLAP